MTKRPILLLYCGINLCISSCSTNQPLHEGWNQTGKGRWIDVRSAAGGTAKMWFGISPKENDNYTWEGAVRDGFAEGSGKITNRTDDGELVTIDTGTAIRGRMHGRVTKHAYWPGVQGIYVAELDNGVVVSSRKTSNEPHPLEPKPEAAPAIQKKQTAPVASIDRPLTQEEIEKREESWNKMMGIVGGFLKVGKHVADKSGISAMPGEIIRGFRASAANSYSGGSGNSDGGFKSTHASQEVSCTVTYDGGDPANTFKEHNFLRLRSSLGGTFSVRYSGELQSGSSPKASLRGTSMEVKFDGSGEPYSISNPNNGKRCSVSSWGIGDN